MDDLRLLSDVKNRAPRSPFNGNGIAMLAHETLQGLSIDYLRVSHRQLSNTAAEEAVIAAILLDEREVAEEAVLSILTPEMFHGDVCRAAYKAWLWLRERDLDASCISVAFAWSELGWIEDIDKVSGYGAEVWLAEIAGKYFTAIGVVTNARIVRDLHVRREQLTSAQEMAKDAIMPKGENARGVKVRGLKRVVA